MGATLNIQTSVAVHVFLKIIVMILYHVPSHCYKLAQLFYQPPADEVLYLFFSKITSYAINRCTYTNYPLE